MKYIPSLFFVIILFPGLVQAKVHITEIAWMGTTNSQYSEWLELYNDADSSVNLSGWKLRENTEQVFTFTKSVAAKSYLLLERTTASAPDAVVGVADESGSFGGGGLANTGEDLVLTDATGQVVESLLFGSGWPAGDATTKETMQWNGQSWITAPATPKEAATAIDQQGGSGDDGDPKDTSSGEISTIPKISPNKPYVDFIVPEVLYMGVPYQFEARPVLEYNYKIEHGSFDWNMGEGTVFKQDTPLPLTHTYQHPGVYSISFRYIDPSNQYPVLKASKKITVLAPVFTIAIINQHILEIKNTLATPLDLSGWGVLFPGGKVSIPDMTVVAEKATIGIPLSTLSIGKASFISILDPLGSVVASTGQVVDESLVRSRVQVSQVVDSVSSVEQLVTDADTPSLEEYPSVGRTPLQNHTKGIIFGVVLLFVIGLSILLERFMVQQE